MNEICFDCPENCATCDNEKCLSCVSPTVLNGGICNKSQIIFEPNNCKINDQYAKTCDETSFIISSLYRFFHLNRFEVSYDSGYRFINDCINLWNRYIAFN